MNGGVLFAEASEGRPSFDTGFREEMAKVLPASPLTALPANHSIFKQPNPIASVKARPALAALSNNQTELAPELYGIDLNGSLAVIYSPHDLSTGWERALAPYAMGYEAPDSIAIGVNILYYAITH